MHSVCRDMYKRDSPVNVFMNQIDPDVVMSLCMAALPPEGLFLFDPEKESPELLREWLAYRGVDPLDDDSQLAEQVAEDMRDRRNSPSISGFANFDVANASTQFLKLWLSWFGVGSQTKQKRGWWETLAREVQALRRNVQERGSGHLRMQWKSLVDAQRTMDRMMNFVVCSGAALAQEEWRSKRLRRSAMRNTSPTSAASGETVFAKYKDVKPLSKKKLKKRWKKHERDLETVSFMSLIDAKKALSTLLQASVVVAPLFIKDGKITTEKVDALKTRALNYKKKLDKNLTFREKANQFKSDFTESLDMNLMSKVAKAGLGTLGLGSDAAILSTLARQVLTKGTKGIDPTELAEVQARNSSIGYTLAQVAMRTLTGEKTKSDEMRKALKAKEAEDEANAE